MNHVRHVAIKDAARRILSGSALLFFAHFAAAQGQACGPLENAYGPYNYRVHRGEQLHLVESAHFTTAVESLIAGATARLPGPDLDYTLRAFPNHHRALVAVIKLADREKKGDVPPAGMRYTVDCWLSRAVRFAPTDPIVKLLYAGFLTSRKRTADALVQLREAEHITGDEPFTHYNIGLAYLEAGDHDNALKQAHRAISLGFPRTDLKERLQQAGRWTEPAPESTPKRESGATSGGVVRP